MEGIPILSGDMCVPCWAGLLRAHRQRSALTLTTLTTLSFSLSVSGRYGNSAGQSLFAYACALLTSIDACAHHVHDQIPDNRVQVGDLGRCLGVSHSSQRLLPLFTIKLSLLLQMRIFPTKSTHLKHATLHNFCKVAWIDI